LNPESPSRETREEPYGGELPCGISHPHGDHIINVRKRGTWRRWKPLRGGVLLAEVALKSGGPKAPIFHRTELYVREGVRWEDIEEGRSSGFVVRKFGRKRRKPSRQTSTKEKKSTSRGIHLRRTQLNRRPDREKKRGGGTLPKQRRKFRFLLLEKGELLLEVSGGEDFPEGQNRTRIVFSTHKYPEDYVKRGPRYTPSQRRCAFT